MKKRIIIAIAFLLITISFSQNIYAQDYQGPIEANTYLSTVRITRNIKQKITKIIKKKKVVIDTLTASMGTGFFVFRTMPDKTLRVFLATNKHMVGDWSLNDSLVLDNEIVVGCYTKNNLYKNIIISLKDKNGKIAKNVHPYPNQVVDVAVIEITEFLSSKFLNDFALYAIPIDNLVSLEKLERGYNIHTGEQVLITGYPSNISIASQGKPIVKTAIISSPLIPIDINMKIINRKNIITDNLIWGKLILIDGFIVGGNSGGPVFTPIQKSLSNSPNSNNYIIGIVSSVYNNTGLSLIYASDYIKDMIYQYTQ